MVKWIAEFELEDGDTMPEHMDLEYKGARIDFYCRPLEQEPTTKNNLGVDCIKKSDAINIIQDMHGLARADVISDAVNRIITMPSVTPQEPKTGKWISTETKGVRYAFWCRYKCYLCGGLSAHTNFCPNCGCRMVEPQESEG